MSKNEMILNVTSVIQERTNRRKYIFQEVENIAKKREIVLLPLALWPNICQGSINMDKERRMLKL